MITATSLKNGTKFLLDGKPFQVMKYSHQKIARGGGTVKLSVRNLETGNLEIKTFNSTVKVDEISTSKKRLQFLYQDDVEAFFMDQSNFNQIQISLSVLGDQIKYIKPGEQTDILFWDDKPLSVDIAPKITLKVKDTAPGVKGNSATNIYKPATLENDLLVKVPLFVKIGDQVRVDTRTGDYIERVST